MNDCYETVMARFGPPPYMIIFRRGLIHQALRAQ